jgi:hypothetical protein
MLTSFSTDCEDDTVEYVDGFVFSKDERYRKTPYFLEKVDLIAKCFGIKRIVLTDASTSKLDRDIDLSLYMVMKHGKTLYERYGYRFCDTQIDFQVQKNLLRKFPFTIFLQLLSPQHTYWVKERIKKMKTTSTYNTLGDFYVDVYDLYHFKDKTKPIRQLQNILNDKTKIWYSMIDVISQKKVCMDKHYK